MITLLLPFLPYIVAALGALVALWRYGAGKKAQGRDEAIQQVNKVNEQAQAEIATDAKSNAGLPDGELDKRLSEPNPNNP